MFAYDRRHARAQTSRNRRASVISATVTPLSLIASKISGVKCSPAVGAAIAPRFARENGLIPFAVRVDRVRLTLYIWRQRRLPISSKIVKITVRLKPDHDTPRHPFSQPPPPTTLHQRLSAYLHAVAFRDVPKPPKFRRQSSSLKISQHSHPSRSGRKALPEIPACCSTPAHRPRAAATGTQQTAVLTEPAPRFTTSIRDARSLL